MKNLLKGALLPLLLALSFGASADLLDDIKEKGELVCGVDGGLAGFSSVDSDGNFKGLDVDVCRAIAAAIFGDDGDDNIKYVSLTAKERFTALSSGEIDVLSRNTTWTMLRDTQLGISFPGVVNYYDGQGFLVRNELGVNSASQLDGATFCIQAGTTTELNLADYFRANNMKYKSVTYDTSQQTKDGFETGRCDVLTSDTSQLAAIRSTLKEPESASVLGDIISKEPLGPVVVQGEERLGKVVRWSVIAMLNAEELGVTQSNVDRMTDSDNPNIRRLLGVEGEFGEKLGIRDDWGYQIIKTVGNYGESFDRNVGAGSPLGLPRGSNALWTNGGLQYGAPIR